MGLRSKAYELLVNSPGEFSKIALVAMGSLACAYIGYKHFSPNTDNPIPNAEQLSTNQKTTDLALERLNITRQNPSEKNLKIAARVSLLIIGGLILAIAMKTTNSQEETVSRPSQWKIAFTPEALKFDADKRIMKLWPSKLENRNVSFETLKSDIEKPTTRIWMDGGAVNEIRIMEKSLSSREFGSCIAVLALGYEDKNNKPTYQGLHHIFFQTKKFEETLSTLIKHLQLGTIDLFISGGVTQSQDLIERALSSIRRLNTTRCKIHVKDNTFGIADIGPHSKRFQGTEFLVDKPTILHVGFTEDYHPFQIIHIRDPQ